MLGKRIFVVEDEGIVAADLEDRLKSLGYSVAGSAASAEDALSIISDTQPDLVLMDIVLRGEMTGIEAADRIRLTADIPVVFLTSHADTSTLSRACQTEPLGYLLKPFEERDLQVTIELALYRHEAGRKLRRMERWLATTLNSIGDGIVATDNAGRVTFLNPVAEGLTGWSASEAFGQEFMDVFHARHAVTGELISNPVLNAIHRGAVVTLDPHTLLHPKAGDPIPIDDSAAPIRDDRGATTGAVLVFRDSTERLRAEAEIRKLNAELETRVQARTVQLTAAIQELKSFSYSISHDLRAPLRAISGFSNLLMERSGPQLDAESQRMLRNVCEAAGRMGRMVDGFLRLARLGRQPMRPVQIDMHQLARAIITDLAAEAREPVPVVNLTPLPSATGDPALLRQVWVNLLANAFKFTTTQPNPTIDISGRTDADELIYSIRDNGVGFNMDYMDKLFGSFQRLHSNEEFEGTGLGLAIVSRIILRHGGRVWAEGVVDQGAVFHFALPVQLPPAEPIVSDFS
jgi:PAS domain S-box-containing protein